MVEEEGVRERLLAFLADNKISQAKFEKECGLSNGYVNNIRSSIQPDKLQRIALRYPALNIAWLMLGDATGEEMYRIPKPVSYEPEKNKSGLPLLPMEAMAGQGSLVYDDARIEDYYVISEFRNSDFLIRVKGDSMAPKFTGGDIVACKRVEDRLFYQWGRVYVIYTKSQGVMIKRVQPSDKDGHIRCVSDNAKYAPFDVPTDDIAGVALVNGTISIE